MRSIVLLALAFACAAPALGCAGMVVGSGAWFDGQKPDVQKLAAVDLQCTGGPIDYAPVSMGDYREVEAHGCGKKARYELVKVGPFKSWSKTGDVSAM